MNWSGSLQLRSFDDEIMVWFDGAGGAAQEEQEARLRSAIATYFSQDAPATEAPPAAAPAVALTGGCSLAATACGIPAVSSDKVLAAAAAATTEAGCQAEEHQPLPPVGVGAQPPAAAGPDLTALPVRAGHSGLALDARELLAFARRNGQARSKRYRSCFVVACCQVSCASEPVGQRWT